MKTALIFDGNYCLYRAKHTMGHLTNGVPYGVLRITKAVVDQFTPNKVIYAFDSGAPKRRILIYPNYKANRQHASPGEDRAPVDKTAAKAFLVALGVSVIEFPDTEADDIIGVLTNYISEHFDRVVVVSSDADLFQLVVGDKVVVYNPMDKEIVDEKAIAEMYNGLKPAQIIDVKCIAGDKSDNIAGVGGIGEIGAIKAVNIIGSVDNLPSDKLMDDKKLSKLNSSQGLEIVRLNRQIVTIARSVDDLDAPLRKPMGDALLNVMTSSPPNIKTKAFEDMIKSYSFKSIDVKAFVTTFSLLNKKLDGWLV